MRDPIKIDDLNYRATNAWVTSVTIAPEGFFVNLFLGVSDKGELPIEHRLTFPHVAHMGKWLCSTLGVDDLGSVRDGESRCYVRALALGNSIHNDVTGIAHIIYPFGLSLFDYYVDADPGKGLTDLVISSMHDFHGAPNTPWTLVAEAPHPNPEFTHRDYQLFGADGHGLGYIKSEDVADWLALEIQIAKFADTPPKVKPKKAIDSE